MTPILLRVYLPCPSSIVRPPRPMAFRRLLTPQTRGAGERLPPPNPPRPHPSPVVACWGRPPSPPAAPLPSSCAFFLLRRSGATWAETQVQSRRRLGSPSSFLPYSLFHLVSLSPLLLGGGIGPRRGGEDGYNGMARRGERLSLGFGPPLFYSPRKMLVQAAHHSMRRTTYGQFFGEKKKFLYREDGGGSVVFFHRSKVCLDASLFFAVSNERRSIESVKRGFGCFCHLPPLFCSTFFAMPGASLRGRHISPFVHHLLPLFLGGIPNPQRHCLGPGDFGIIFLAPRLPPDIALFARVRNSWREREGGRRLSRMPSITFPVRKCRDFLVLTFLKYISCLFRAVSRNATS